MAGTAELIAQGLQRHQAGEWDAAARLYAQALDVTPRFPEALHLLGVLAHQRGAHHQAVTHFQQAIAANPGEAAYHSNLGSAQHALGQYDAAVDSYGAALRLDPRRPETYHNLGNTYSACLEFQAAAASFQSAIALDSQYAKAYMQLGRVLQRLGQHEEAVTALRRAIELAPGMVVAYELLADSLCRLGQRAEAIEAYDQYLLHDPNCAQAIYNKGVIELDDYRLMAAELSFAQAVELAPDFPEAYCNRGITFLAQGRVREAVDNFRTAVRIRPNYAMARSNLLMALHYDPATDEESLYEEHLQWAAVLERAETPVLENTRDPHRRLRIGYVSPDLREHAVSHFFEPILRQHFREAVHVNCYADVAKPDATTTILQSLADNWRNVHGLSDNDFAAHVRRDEIDILIDLAGHTAGNRMSAFARRLAPVQVSYIGYGSTTGLACMDYRIVDNVTNPADETSWHTEVLARHTLGFACYAPPHDAPPVTAPPSVETGHVTFGCFNNIDKVSPPVVQLWADLINAVPDSRLYLKTRAFNDPGVAAAWRRQFAAAGLAPERLELLSRSRTVAEHLAHYRHVDIALDPFPYTGSTTTCEALWMGVPVVSLRGNNYVGRMTASLLETIGAKELIAETQKAYLAIAERLATDPQSLSAYRQQLRGAMADSAICDATPYTRALETLYRDMWQRWCGGER